MVGPFKDVLMSSGVPEGYFRMRIGDHGSTNVLVGPLFTQRIRNVFKVQFDTHTSGIYFRILSR